MSKTLNFFVVFITTAFLLLEINGFKGIKGLESQVEIRAFLNETVSPDSVKSFLAKEPGIEKVIFVSKKEALDEFRRNIKNSESLIGQAEENPLPPSFKLILKPGYKNPEYLQALETKTLHLDGVNNFIYSKDYFKSIWTIIKYFEWLSIGLYILLFLLFIFTITTSISHSFLKHRDEFVLLGDFGVNKFKIVSKTSLRSFLENIIFVIVSIGLDYLIYYFLLKELQINAPLFFSTKMMLILIGSIGILALFISFIFSALIDLREGSEEV